MSNVYHSHHLMLIALDWVNQQRVRMGRPILAQLQPGACSDPSRCTLAESLGTGWIGGNAPEPGRWWHSGDDYFGDVPLPPKVDRFVELFDTHIYPELIA